MNPQTRIAIVGCGYVADFYLKTLRLHPDLAVAGVMDRDPARAARFASHYSVPLRRSLDEILQDRSVDIVVNLTNPSSHFAVSRAALESGKHVYSEKPLSVDFNECRRLVDLAEERGLCISSAPCSLLGETAQTVWKALRDNAIGQPWLVYAELDDGLVHQMPYRKWISESGSPWPWKDEFEVGCTLEHAGYYLTWLPAFFGPAKTVSAFASCLVPDKATSLPLDRQSPDFSVACIHFHSGVVARLTCSIIAPVDHSLRIFGQTGVLSIKDCWDYRSPVYIRRRINIRRSTIMSPWARKYPLVGPRRRRFTYGVGHKMDFARGIAELADSIRSGRRPRLSARYCLHVNELVLAIHNADAASTPRELTTTFDPIEPYF